MGLERTVVKIHRPPSVMLGTRVRRDKLPPILILRPTKKCNQVCYVKRRKWSMLEYVKVNLVPGSGVVKRTSAAWLKEGIFYMFEN